MDWTNAMVNRPPIPDPRYPRKAKKIREHLHVELHVAAPARPPSSRARDRSNPLPPRPPRNGSFVISR